MRRLVSPRPEAGIAACAGTAWFLLSVCALQAQATTGPPEDGAPPAEAAASSEWVARNWQTGDGLPHNTVNAILQTRDGYLWAGTNGGLARFDGLHFRSFGLQEGLLAVHILSLAETTDGTLWAGTSGGGVSQWKNGRLITHGGADGFPEDADVLCMTPDADGSLWIGTTVGLIHWQQGRFTILGDSHGLPQKQVRALARSTDGSLWVSVIGDGVYQRKDGRFTRVSGTGPVTGDCYSLMGHRDGTVWAGAGNGKLWRLKDGQWRAFDPSSGLPRASYVSMREGLDGSVWLAVPDHGLYRARGDRFEQVALGEERFEKGVNGVTADDAGSIWFVAPSGGLTRLSRRLLYYWTGDAQQPISPTTIAEDPDGTWWLGTSNDGIHRFESGRFTKISDPRVTRISPRIYCGVAGSDGSIWMAGEQFLHRFKSGQWAETFMEPPIRGEAIRAMCVEGDTVWIGTYYSTLLKYASGKIETVAPAGSFGGGITSMVLESPGVLWIGSSGGLHRWERGNIRRWGTRDGLLTRNVRSLFRDSDGTLWMGTMGGGLARMKQGVISNFTTRDGLVDDIISQVAADRSGHLWLGCNRGIMRIERQELEAVSRGGGASLHPVVFGGNEGMLKEQCAGGHSPTVIETRDGRLLFPVAGGVVEIDPTKLPDAVPAAPRTTIESVSINGLPASPEGQTSVPAGQHHLEITYTAPALGGAEWLRFRHRIEGLDVGWTPGSSRRAVSFDGLPPGRYVFRVAASDGRGHWSAHEAGFAFVIQPFFWQTLWFRVGGMLLLLLAGGLAVWGYSRSRHRRQMADFERSRQQHAELAHASRVSLLGELSASLAHELKQPLASILSNAQAALRFLNSPPIDTEEVRGSLQDIADADRRANEIIERMRAMIKKGQAEMELRDVNSDIHQALLLIHSDLVGRNVVVTTDLSPDLPPVSADHIQLQQVLINLIMNGCDAMDALAPDQRRLFIETKKDQGALVRVSVSDRGTGITPELQENIFKPFFSTKRNGLGMGLSICRAIIRAHGGQLWALNHPDGGAVLHFTLQTGKIVAPAQPMEDELPGDPRRG